MVETGENSWVGSRPAEQKAAGGYGGLGRGVLGAARLASSRTWGLVREDVEEFFFLFRRGGGNVWRRERKIRGGRRLQTKYMSRDKTVTTQNVEIKLRFDHEIEQTHHVRHSHTRQ